MNWRIDIHCLLVFAILPILITGCSKPGGDTAPNTGIAIEEGMSIEVDGPLGKRIVYSIHAFDATEKGTKSKWENGDFRLNENEEFTHKIDSTQTGYLIAVYVPFSGKTKLKLLKDGMEIQSSESLKAGTLLKMEVGSVPEDKKKEIDLSECQLTEELKSIKAALIATIGSEDGSMLKGTSLFQDEMLPGLIRFAKKMKAKHGKFAGAGSDVWIYVGRADGIKIMEGTVKFGTTEIPFFAGIVRNELDLIKYFDGEKRDWLEVVTVE